MLSRYRLTLEYDGTAFLGWQRQASGHTVQGILQASLHQLCGHPVTVVGAGRTDTGVHALGQVAHFDTSNPRSPTTFARALNALTPSTLTILDVSATTTDFHARFSAVYREYWYRIVDTGFPSALRRGRVWHYGHPLDLELLANAAQHFLGTHDFSSFRAASCQSASPVRTLERFDVLRHNDEIWLLVGCKSFLHHMIRNLVGSLVLVGSGRWTLNHLLDIFSQCNRQLAGATAPAEGLYFLRSVYALEDKNLNMLPYKYFI